MIHIGIDPGLSGGVAFLPDPRTGEPAPFVMPTGGGEVDPGMLANLIRGITCGQAARVAIERVGAMPGQGVSSTFKFGTGWGMARGVCAALGLPVVLVTPQRWKKEVLAGLPHDKDGAIRYCASRWPGLSLVLPRCRVPHDGMADSLCIAAWMERQP
jgi:crossover junction endodeoxyribonuclease RuvC